jgi:hypothetical protein
MGMSGIGFGRIRSISVWVRRVLILDSIAVIIRGVRLRIIKLLPEGGRVFYTI